MTLASPLHKVHPVALPHAMHTAALACLATLLADCGGGGGDDTDTPPGCVALPPAASGQPGKTGHAGNC